MDVYLYIGLERIVRNVICRSTDDEASLMDRLMIEDDGERFSIATEVPRGAAVRSRRVHVIDYSRSNEGTNSFGRFAGFRV